MPSSDINGRYREIIYSYGRERKKKLTAYVLLMTGLVLFILTLSGFTDGISKWTESFLFNNLGYTNKWSKTFGPAGFVHTMNDISALAGKFLIFIIIILVTVYYKIRAEHKLLWKFLITALGGLFLLQVLKLIFADNIPYEPLDFLIDNISTYPSGHAMMSMIIYLTLAVILTRRQRRYNVRVFTLISALIIIFLIGLSRIFGAAHNVTEVLAGWSAGLVWLCICWLIERFIKTSYKLEI